MISLVLLHPFLTPPTHLPSHKTSSSSFCSLVRFRRTLRLRCSGGGETAGSGKDLISGVVEEQVEALLSREENRHLLDGLQDASARVDLARQELAEIERQEAEFSRAKDRLLQLQKRESEIAECQREVLEAKVMIEEAEKSLSMNMDQTIAEQAMESTDTEEIDKGLERWESIKSASISSLVGTLAGFPIALYEVTDTAQLLLRLAVLSISCALFGVTFRYAIRRDLDNIQLKTGMAAAFGFVRGLATMEAAKTLKFDSSSYISHAIDGGQLTSLVVACRNPFAI